MDEVERLGGIETPTLNAALKAICVGTLESAGRATLMKGGFKNSTRNSLVKAISGVTNLHVTTYVWNRVLLTTLPFGLEPAMKILLRIWCQNYEQILQNIREELPFWCQGY
jgi:hypothetical protein